MFDITFFAPYCLIAGRVLIGFYFFFFVFWNSYHWRPTLDVMHQQCIPFAFPLLIFGICFQGITGLFIMLATYTAYAAALLVVFDVFATFVFHRFWTMESGPARTLNTIIFIGNLTVTLGGLLLLVGLEAAMLQH